MTTTKPGPLRQGSCTATCRLCGILPVTRLPASEVQHCNSCCVCYACIASYEAHGIEMNRSRSICARHWRATLSPSSVQAHVPKVFKQDASDSKPFLCSLFLILIVQSSAELAGFSKFINWQLCRQPTAACITVFQNDSTNTRVLYCCSIVLLSP